MGIDHSIKHRKISRVFLEGTLQQSITLLEKKKRVLTKEGHIHSSKVVINPHPVLMAHGLCMFMYPRGSTW